MEEKKLATMICCNCGKETDKNYAVNTIGNYCKRCAFNRALKIQIEKDYESGLMDENIIMDAEFAEKNNQNAGCYVGDLLRIIHRLQSENKRLKDEKEEIKLFNLAIQNGEIDMRIESEMAKSFYNSIVQVFEQNGAKNFFTTTIDVEGKKGRYAFTIEKVGGQTVAEKLAEQKAEIERLTKWKDKLQDTKDELEQQLIDTGFKEYCEENKQLTEQNAELQKQVDELTELQSRGSFRVAELGIENAKLQKQVDELTEENIQTKVHYENQMITLADGKDNKIIKLHKQIDKLKTEMHKIESSENETYMLGFEEGEKQAVKDTAKEIFTKVDNAFSLYYPHGQIPYSVFQERLKRLAKEKGVEVE